MGQASVRQWLGFAGLAVILGVGAILSLGFVLMQGCGC
jgi:hypothetical protein